MLTAIIVAAGKSQRMGFDKLLAPLGGKPVIAHALEAFERTESVTEVILVVHRDRLREFEQLARGQSFTKVRQVVAGGKERHHSVLAGLEMVGKEAEFVAVHDAARPLITPEQIERVFAICRMHHAAALGEPVNDTLKRVTEDCVVCGGVDRDRLYALQTPQIFWRELLTKAYEAVVARQLRVTDETSAVEYLGEPIVVVPSEDFNFKITYPTDLPLAEFVLSRRQTGADKRQIV